MKRLTEAWFEFKGINSRDMGILLKSMPVRYIPGRNITRKHASGVDGTYAYGDSSYNDARVQLECDLRDESKLNDVLAWLTGDGLLIFSDEPDLAYEASIEKEYSRASITARLTGQRFTVTWTCKPFRRIYPPAPPKPIYSSGTPLPNPGTAYSLPRVEIHGSGNFSVTIGNETLFFSDISGGIIVDSELMDALTLDGTASLNDNMSGTPYKIRPGANVVSWETDEGSSIDSVIITPRWRCF